MEFDTVSLVLIRHGSSEWNVSGRFTGWTDISMSELGHEQARAAGMHLAAAGFVFDEVHVSMLRRTHETADSLLAAMQHPPVPRYEHWRLNERHYGQLQGLDKEEIFAVWGEQRARHWWRGYVEAPPPVESIDPRHPVFDPLYADVDPALLPHSESLSDCQRRLLPYWESVLAPRIADGLRLLVVSHGNTMRSLIMHLEKLAPEKIEKLEILPGVPLVYNFDEALEVTGYEWLS